MYLSVCPRTSLWPFLAGERGFVRVYGVRGEEGVTCEGGCFLGCSFSEKLPGFPHQKGKLALWGSRPLHIGAGQVGHKSVCSPRCFHED
jgi:hypothetical protein